MPQILRVIPYSSIQLGSYELLKRAWADGEGRLSLPKRLAAGACAGMIATLVGRLLPAAAPHLLRRCTVLRAARLPAASAHQGSCFAHQFNPET